MVVKQMIRRLVCCLMALMLLAMPVCGLALEKSANPLLGGLTMDKHTKTEDRIVNILLLGIDYGLSQSQKPSESLSPETAAFPGLTAAYRSFWTWSAWP